MRDVSNEAGVKQFGDTKIEQLRHAFGRDQNVRRLDVAMNNLLLVRVVKRIAD